jgi:capsular exopolysaccharide synthesis family protein
VIPLGKIYDALEKSQHYSTNDPSASSRTHLKTVENTNDIGRVEPKSFPMSLNSRGNRLDDSLISYYKPQSIEAEQFRKLAATIVFQNPGVTSRCLLVTSVNKGEGKSFLTSNLAISLAKSLEEPVLLMDCDLRRPSLHTRFGFRDVPGLSDHFMKGMDISSLIQKTSVNQLSLLPAGSKSFHSAELLSSKRMAQLLKTLKKTNKGKIILIDSPPPSATAEPVAIASQVDGIILTVQCESTPREMVVDLVKNLGKEKILGVVLNRFKRPFSAYKKYEMYQ